MRTIWLASTALLLTAGIACAQSAPTPSPAPTGGLAAPQASPAPGASPGSMAPSNSSSGAPMGGMSSNAPPANGAAAPAPNGAVNAPDVTAATPGAAPGKTAPNAGNAQSAMNAPAHPWHHHWSSGSGSLPQNASASTYLHIASAAIGHHNTALAEDALSHAETRLLNRAVPQGQVAADDTPAIQSIESARQALHTGNFSQASADARQAASSASSS